METMTRKRLPPTCRNSAARSVTGPAAQNARSVASIYRSTLRRNAGTLNNPVNAIHLPAHHIQPGRASIVVILSSTSYSPSADLSKTNWIYIDVDPDGGGGAEQEQEEKFSPVLRKRKRMRKGRALCFTVQHGRSIQMGMVDALINRGDGQTPYHERKRNTSCDGSPGMHTSTPSTKDVTSTSEISSSISGTPAKTIPFRDLPLANKRIRKGGEIISHTNRFNTSKNHVRIRIQGVDQNNLPRCVYCRWLKAHDNLEEAGPKRTAMTCAACPGIALCRDHFDTYHQREAEEAKSSLQYCKMEQKSPSQCLRILFVHTLCT